LTERLEGHRTVNACSALCLSAVGQLGLVLWISWELMLEGRWRGGYGFFQGLVWEVDASFQGLAVGLWLK
jgi:hypothetical protein